MFLTEPVPTNFPLFGGRPGWVAVVAFVLMMAVMWKVNDYYFAWLRGVAPWALRPRAIVTILAVCLIVGAIGAVVSLPPAVWKAFLSNLK